MTVTEKSKRILGSIYLTEIKEKFMKYKNILFDLDDTLLDFVKSEARALQQVFEQYNIPYTKEHIRKYKEINHELWVAYESGKIERHVIFESRFPQFLQLYGYDIKGTVVDETYRRFLMDGHDVIEGAIQVLQSLQATHRLYVVTNGLKEMQQKRLRDSGLEKYFDKIFISEDVGYKKPDIEFFEHVFSFIPEFKHEETIIVGDMLHADILGGFKAGIDTVWVNNKDFKLYVNVSPTYEIKHVNELHAILSN